MEVEQLYCNHKWSKEIIEWQIVPTDMGAGLIVNDWRPIYSEKIEWCHLCGEKRPYIQLPQNINTK